MELRPLQTALVAGRAASRWTTSSTSPSLLLSSTSRPTPVISAFQRHVSTTKPSLQQEAAAPAPRQAATMVDYMKAFKNSQQQQQQRHQSDPIEDLFRHTAARKSSNPSATPPSPSSNPAPWAAPRPAKSNQQYGIVEDLFNSSTGPSKDDFGHILLEPSYQSVADVKLRLRPSLGRTVHCGPGRAVDVARGLSLLNRMVQTNKVRSDQNKQRFHERPGLKRKRLRSERWRVRFKEGFKATCGRVRELANQGW